MGLLLTGCAAVPAHERWHNASASPAQTEQDEKNCKFEAEKSTSSSGGGFAQGIEDGVRKLKLTEMCMELRGYKR